MRIEVAASGAALVLGTAAAFVLGAGAGALALVAAGAAMFVLLLVVSRRTAAQEAAVASAAAEEKQLQDDMERLERSSYRDLETGLGNDRLLNLHWSIFASRYARCKEPFSLALVEARLSAQPEAPLPPDILAELAAAIDEVARGEDAVARISPWIFAVLLATADEEGGRRFVERARARFSQVGPATPLLVTGGSAEWRPEMADLKTLARAANARRSRFAEGLQEQQREWKGS
jgi:GGDEF domain-containing protein